MLPITLLSRKVRVAPRSFMMPPPSASLVRLFPATLLVTETLSSVIVPALSMPPPLAPPNGWLPHPGAVDAGAAWLSLTTLSEILTVAPSPALDAGT